MGRNVVPEEKITKEMLLDVLEYKDGELFWVKPKAHWVKKGAKAGYIRSDGYSVINIFGKPRLTHRLIWKMFHGEVPALIDHIDRDNTNNRISNLRESNKCLNAYNCGIPSNNKTGHRGVSRNGKSWVAAAKVSGRYVRKSFKTLEEAIECRQQLLQKGGQGNEQGLLANL